MRKLGRTCMPHEWAYIGLAFLFTQPALAQTVSPSVEYFLGPSLGKKWELSGAWTGGVNAQTGTTYTVLATDMGKLVTFSNGSAIAVTLPQAGTVGFEAGREFCVLDLGAGSATVTPTTSTVNGSATKVYATGASGCIRSDGTNYLAR
jgi:hypothetical protein